MRTYGDLEAVGPELFQHPVATIGVFDGVHRGHQHLFAELEAWARELGDSDTVVITFRRHPLVVLGKIPPAILTSLEHRLVLLDRCGVSAALVLDFDREMASWSPERFVREILGVRLGCRHLLMGFNAAFGKDARGNAEYLRRHPELDLEVRSASAFLLDGKPVSSTEIRRLIMSGELHAARRLLGRPVSLYGEVVAGDGRGRELGFPTANLDLFHSAAPPRGVYIAEVCLGEKPYGALVNIGRRPTFLDANETSDQDRRYDEKFDVVEIHVRDFAGDLYGSRLEVFLHEKIRDERRFESVDALIEQIRLDAQRLEEWWKSR